MLGIAINLPPFAEQFFAATTPDMLAAYALLIVGPIPILGVIVWGFSHLWLEFKQGKFESTLKWITLEVKVPQTSVQTPKGMENFFSNLAGAKSGLTWREAWLLGKTQARFSFEIISNGGDISFVIRAQEKFRDILEADLYAQYPEAQITEIPDYTDLIAKEYPNDDQDIFGAEVVLAKEHFLPIRNYGDFEHQGEKDNRFKDPLLSLLELMGKMRPGEYLWMQLILAPTSSDDWIKKGLAYLGKVMGKEDKSAAKSGGILDVLDQVFWFPFNALEQIFGINLGGSSGASPEKKADDFRMFRLTTAEKMQIDAVAEKISKVGWQAKIRWVGVGPKNAFRKGIFASGMKGAFQPFNNPLLNQFATHGPSVPNDDYFWKKWSYFQKQTTLAKRYASRSFGAGATPCILNAEELATLFHFPSADARTPVLTAMGARRSEAPHVLPTAPTSYVGASASASSEPTSDDWRRVYLERRTQQGTTEAVPSLVPEKPVVPHAVAPSFSEFHGEVLPRPHVQEDEEQDLPPDNLPV